MRLAIAISRISRFQCVLNEHGWRKDRFLMGRAVLAVVLHSRPNAICMIVSAMMRHRNGRPFGLSSAETEIE